MPLNMDDYTVQKIMERCDISRAEAAMAMNVNKSMVGHYLTGKRVPPVERIQLLARYAVMKVEQRRAEGSIHANVADVEAKAEARAAASVQDPFRAWWSSHSRQLKPDGQLAWLPVPAPYPYFPDRRPNLPSVSGPQMTSNRPGYEGFPVPAPVEIPPAGHVHMFDHDAQAWTIELEPA